MRPMDASARAGDVVQLEAEIVRAPILTGVVGKVGEAASLAVLVALVPRALGPANYGTFALGLSVVTMGSSALSVGAAALLVRFVPSASEQEQAPLARALGERIARRRLWQIGLIGAAAAILISVAPGLFSPLPVVLFAVALSLDLGATLCFQLALGLGRNRLWSFRYPLQNTFLTAAALLLGSIAGSTGALAALALASGAALIVGAAAIAGPLRGPKRDASVPTEFLRFGQITGLGSLLYLVAHRSGVVVVALLANPRETGFAALALGVGLAALYSVWQISTLQLATLSRYADRDLEWTERQARRLAAQTLTVLIPPALLGGLVLERVIVLVFGTEFRGAEPAFVPVLALFPLLPLTALANQVAALRVRPEARLRASAAGLLVFVIAAPLSVAEWGAVGATGSLLASTLAAVVVSVRVLPRLAGRALLAASLVGSILALTIAAVS